MISEIDISSIEIIDKYKNTYINNDIIMFVTLKTIDIFF